MSDLAWLDEIDLRRDLGRVAAALQAEVAAGRVPTLLIAAVGARAPVALVDLLVGPRAPASPELVRGALEVIGILEQRVPPKALYRRLVELAGPAAIEVLEVAASRHPLGTDWLLPLSVKVEGEAAGRTLLRAVAWRPELAMVCQAAAVRGLLSALFELAREGSRPEPAVALVQAGRIQEAARATALALEGEGDRAGVLAAVQAAWGPDWEGLCRRVLPHCLHPGAVEALRSLLLSGSPVLPLLFAVERGLARS